MNMDQYVSLIKPIYLSLLRRKDASYKAMRTEYDAYRALAGTIIWKGNGMLRKAAFVAPYMQKIYSTVNKPELWI